MDMSTPESTFLTPDAYEKLRSELEYLTTDGRAEIEVRIQEAREHGDLRENADYDAAKNDQGMMEARIRQIEGILTSAEVREIEVSDRVVVGSLVTVVDGDGDEMEYFVAPTENRRPGVLLASPSGPLGQALLGAKPGDDVAYQAPAGTFTVKVTKIRPFGG
jgi:transcription elongation factor GreA